MIFNRNYIKYTVFFSLLAATVSYAMEHSSLEQQLFAAINSNNPSEVQGLITKKANLCALNAEGLTPLVYALTRQNSYIKISKKIEDCIIKLDLDLGCIRQIAKFEENKKSIVHYLKSKEDNSIQQSKLLVRNKISHEQNMKTYWQYILHEIEKI